MKVIPHTAKSAKNAVKRFCDQVFWLKTINRMFEVLFEKDDSIILMEKSAHSFFYFLSMVLHDYLLLEMAKITDPATSKGKENFTIANLIESIDWPDDTREKLITLSHQANTFRDYILPARHKLIAHTDKKAFLAEMTLGAFPRGEDDKFLKTLSEICDVAHEACFGSIFGHMILAMPGDVINFVRILEGGVAFKELLDESSGDELVKLFSCLEKARQPREKNNNSA